MNQPQTSEQETENGDVRPRAVIDIGATSIRMAIAEIHPDGSVRTLETLAQAVNLGKDTFTKGAISKTTIEDCVRVLKSYGRMLREYRIESKDHLRVVATSAVREASNRLAFLDRVFIATGIEIEPIDEAEVNRITYLGIQPYLQSDQLRGDCDTIVAEVSGGNTELLVVRDGNVVFANTFRMGSLRFRKSLEPFRAPGLQVRNIMETQIHRMVAQVDEHLRKSNRVEMIALGSEIRFAARQILPDWNPDKIARMPLAELESLTNSLFQLTEDEIVRRYHLSFPDAALVVPALLTYLHFGKELAAEQLLVTNTNLRDGLLKEMAAKGGSSDQFRQQIIRSALNLGRRFDFDENHATHVAELARKLFQELQSEHQLSQRAEIILYVAALLHEIGLYISQRSLHKHTMYLISNSELFGIGKKNLNLLALVARYHRRASPQPRHEGFSALSRDQRIVVGKLAAILRIAVALDETRSGRVRQLRCRNEPPNKLVISIPNMEDLSVEQLALRQSGTLFEEVYGREVVLQQETIQD